MQKKWWHMQSQSHLWHKHEKNYSKLFKLSLWNNGTFHWVDGKLHINCNKFSYKKNGWKVCSKLVGFSKFQTYFYMKTEINYDYDMKKL
jgi:hypothetical protein